MMKQMDRNGEVDLKGGIWRSMSTRGLCQALLMLGLLWGSWCQKALQQPPAACPSSTVTAVSTTKRAEGAQSSNRHWDVQVLGGVMCGQAAQMVGSVQPHGGVVCKTSHPVLCFWKGAAPGGYTFERKQLGKAAIVAPSYTYLFICK